MKLYYNIYITDEIYVPCVFVYDSDNPFDNTGICRKILQERGINDTPIAVCEAKGIDL